MGDFRNLSSAELRLDLAAVEAERKNTSMVAAVRRKNRIQAITRELIERGSY